jgi:hypothetical protein
MHLFVAVCGFLSTAIAIYVTVPYILSIVRGQTKPHQLTWLIWTIMNAVVLTSQFLEGARASILITAVWFVTAAIELGLSFKYGVRDSSRYDRLLFIISLLIIVVWVLTRNNVLAIWLTVLIDIPATAMLVLKIKKLPDSEPLWLWNIATVAYVFACLSLADKPLGILYVRPTYGLLSELAVVLAIIYFRPKRGKHTQPKPDAPQAELY